MGQVYNSVLNHCLTEQSSRGGLRLRPGFNNLQRVLFVVKFLVDGQGDQALRPWVIDSKFNPFPGGFIQRLPPMPSESQGKFP